MVPSSDELLRFEPVISENADFLLNIIDGCDSLLYKKDSVYYIEDLTIGTVLSSEKKLLFLFSLYTLVVLTFRHKI